MMHKNILKTIVGASVLTVLALGWVQPAAAQGNQRLWYESETKPAQQKLWDELKSDDRLKPGGSGDGTSGVRQKGNTGQPGRNGGTIHGGGAGGGRLPDAMPGVPPGGRDSYCLSNC